MGSEQNNSIVEAVFKRMQSDSAFRAALKRADNPATEYQSWEYLADYGVQLDDERKRIPYTTVFAAVARSGRDTDGSYGVGKALSAAYDWDKESAPARSKLRRVIACGNVTELCAVLRPVLQFIASKGVPICYQQLLNDLCYFGDGEKVKSRWAQQFFGAAVESREENE